MIELTLDKLKVLGDQVGFQAIGATSAAPFPELVPLLQEYAARGRTGFEHENIEDRVNPERWMPGAKSLIAVAMAYLTGEGRKAARVHPQGNQHGLVTVYSYGEDYHTVMTRRMHELVSLIEAEVGHAIVWKSVVDTAPAVDRRVAERANIGWVGKNCMFYTEPYGSFVFLGTLIVDIEVETRDQVQPAKCGTCDLCLKACPTNALVAPGMIDATRCLSYITQMKGMIPKEYRKAMGRRVWGCDTCQWACPVNKDVEPSPHTEYLPQGELEFPDLLGILSLSNRQFQRMYGHTAAAWRGLRTWQRNALIALGNARHESAIPNIIPFLSSERPELRASAAWALLQIGGAAAIDAIQQAHAAETEEWVREEMEQGGIFENEVERN